MRPLLSKAAAELLPPIDTAISGLEAQFAALRAGDGYRTYDSVNATQRQQIADQAKQLADALDAIDPALGLSGL